jgi:hypothetical protein
MLAVPVISTLTLPSQLNIGAERSTVAAGKIHL